MDLSGSMEAYANLMIRSILEILQPLDETNAFAILGLGSFNPTVNLGLVSAWVVMVALVADLMLLPAALILARPRL